MIGCSNSRCPGELVETRFGDICDVCSGGVTYTPPPVGVVIPLQSDDRRVEPMTVNIGKIPLGPPVEKWNPPRWPSMEEAVKELLNPADLDDYKLQIYVGSNRCRISFLVWKDAKTPPPFMEGKFLDDILHDAEVMLARLGEAKPEELNDATAAKLQLARAIADLL